MITSFAALGGKRWRRAAQKLSEGISEALYNTALGIGTSAISIIMYNIFTTKIDGITYGNLTRVVLPSRRALPPVQISFRIIFADFSKIVVNFRK